MASFNLMGFCQNLILPSVFKRSYVVLTSQRWLRSSMYKKLNLPEPPKRPAGPFAKFVKIQAPLLKKEYPNCKPTDIVRMAGQLWREADESLKLKLKAETEAEKIEYLKELASFKENIAPHKETILKAEDKELKKQKQRELKKLGQPKRPASPFALFVKEEQDKRGNVSITEYMKVLGAKWKMLTKKDKARYEVEFQDQKKEYEKLVADWKNEVVKNIVPSKDTKKGLKKPAK